MTVLTADLLLSWEGVDHTHKTNKDLEEGWKENGILTEDAVN